MENNKLKNLLEGFLTVVSHVWQPFAGIILMGLALNLIEHLARTSIDSVAKVLLMGMAGIGGAMISAKVR